MMWCESTILLECSLFVPYENGWGKEQLLEMRQVFCGKWDTAWRSMVFGIQICMCDGLIYDKLKEDYIKVNSLMCLKWSD